MEKGSLRCDANISIREKGDTKLGTKTELKNMNSFRAVKTALEFEENRHRQVILAGERIIQETRLWNEEKGSTFSMRSKEEAHDYRYFPEPDLVPFVVDVKTVQEIRASLPEGPQTKLERFIMQYKVSEYDAQIIIQDQALADFFEQSSKLYNDTKKICNWLIGPMLSELNARKKNITEISLKPQDLVSLIQKIDDGTLSNLIAKDVFKMMLDTQKSVDKIIQEQGLTQVSDESTLEKIIDGVLSENDKVVEQIRQGKNTAMGFLVGQAMRKAEGKANPKKIGELIKRRFDNV